MARARIIPGVNAKATFAEAAASAIEVRSQEVFSFADGVLDTTDPERVHDMRVATRRLRAALEIFAVCFPKAEHKADPKKKALTLKSSKKENGPDSSKKRKIANTAA